MSIWSCVEYFDIFKMAAILSSLRNFLPEVTPEVEYATKIAISICDILIDALAEILTELLQFNVLTYLKLWWRHQWLNT